MKRILKYILFSVLGILLVGGGLIAYSLHKFGLFKEPVFETEAPSLPENLTSPAMLIFSKTNSFRHIGTIDSSRMVLESMGKTKGWSVFSTENGAIFNDEDLKHFDVVVGNYNSGTILLEEQQEAFKRYIHKGGGFVGLHAAGGDRSYTWQWYVDSLIRAQFVDHPMFPQIQEAQIKIEDATHPAMRHLPKIWTRSDEWYNFAKSPRNKNVQVLATLDESTYEAKFSPMGEDHPIIWCHTIGKGRVFYSGLGHTASTLKEPEYIQMLWKAIEWTKRREM